MTTLPKWIIRNNPDKSIEELEQEQAEKRERARILLQSWLTEEESEEGEEWEEFKRSLDADRPSNRKFYPDKE